MMIKSGISSIKALEFDAFISFNTLICIVVVSLAVNELN